MVTMLLIGSKDKVGLQQTLMGIVISIAFLVINQTDKLKFRLKGPPSVLGNQSIQSCVTQNYNNKPHGGKVGGSPESFRHIIWVPWMPVPTFVQIHPADISHGLNQTWPAGGATGKVRESPKSLGFVLWGPCISEHNLKATPVMIF